MIGKDFPPNDFMLFGFNLTDPTDFVFDILIGLLSFYLANSLSKEPNQSQFKTTWIRFYLFFGLATTFSAFGHLFYNYFHFYGKLIGWMIIPISIYFLEIAVINAHWNQKSKERIKKIYLIKLFLLYLIFAIVLLSQTFVTTHAYMANVVDHPEKLFLPIAVNTILGLLIGVGVFSFLFKKKVSSSFSHIFTGVLIVFPSAIIFVFKINLHKWFSKNDFSHLLMFVGIYFFYLGVKKILKGNHEFLKVK